MKRKREDAVKIAQEKAQHEQIERATKRREAEKFSIKQQMKVSLLTDHDLLLMFTKITELRMTGLPHV